MRFRIFGKENVQGNERKANQLIQFLRGCYEGDMHISIISPFRYPWNTKDMEESDNSLWLWHPELKKTGVKLSRHWRYDKTGTGLMRNISKSYLDWDKGSERDLKIMDYFRESDKKGIVLPYCEGLELTPEIMTRRIGSFSDISSENANKRLSDILIMHEGLLNPFYIEKESEFNDNTKNNLHIFTAFSHIWQKDNGSVKYQGLFHFDGKDTYLTNIVLSTANSRIPEEKIGQIPRWKNFEKGEMFEDGSFYIGNIKIIDPSVRLKGDIGLDINGEDDKGEFTGCTYKPGFGNLRKIEGIAGLLIDLDLNPQEKEVVEINFSDEKEEPEISKGIEEKESQPGDKEDDGDFTP